MTRRFHFALSSLGIALLCVSCRIGAALAGPNAGGFLILSANPGIVYCQDVPNYCDQSGLTACEAAITRHDGPDPVVFFAIAAFPPASAPRLSGITFGVSYDMSRVILTGHGACGDFELPGPNWPSSGEGTAITWNSAQTGQLTEVYWFAGYNYDAPNPTLFSLIPHPVAGGQFADDSIPALLDAIAAYGQLGFDTPAPVLCFGGPATGACCLATCECLQINPDDCAAQDGVYLGNFTPCSPDPCPCPLTGACCLMEGCVCVEVTKEECATQGGYYYGNGSICHPDMCNCPPVYGACCLFECQCLVLAPEVCSANGGTYQGDYVACAPSPCQTGPGACCLSDGSCIEATSCACADAGGSYLGEGVPCSPDPCGPVVTKRSTWGEIKGRYR